jgi:hypothetical protein
LNQTYNLYNNGTFEIDFQLDSPIIRGGLFALQDFEYMNSVSYKSIPNPQIIIEADPFNNGQQPSPETVDDNYINPLVVTMNSTDPTLPASEILLQGIPCYGGWSFYVYEYSFSGESDTEFGLNNSITFSGTDGVITKTIPIPIEYISGFALQAFAEWEQNDGNGNNNQVYVISLAVVVSNDIQNGYTITCTPTDPTWTIQDDSGNDYTQGIPNSCCQTLPIWVSNGNTDPNQNNGLSFQITITDNDGNATPYTDMISIPPGYYSITPWNG